VYLRRGLICCCSFAGQSDAVPELLSRPVLVTRMPVVWHPRSRWLTSPRYCRVRMFTLRKLIYFVLISMGCHGYSSL